jgi:hypothetical protein
MKNVIFSFIMLAVALTACNNHLDEMSDIRTVNDTMTINLHQSCFNNKYNFRIIPDSVLYDSRCPANFNCFWEGDASVRFKMNLNNVQYQFALNTCIACKKDTTIKGINIKLINLFPYPGENVDGRIISNVVIVAKRKL